MNKPNDNTPDYPKEVWDMILRDAELDDKSDLRDETGYHEGPLHIPRGYGAGVPFLELLLLALIDGADQSLTDKEKPSTEARMARLDDALIAITGRPSVYSAGPSHLERQALQHMLKLALDKEDRIQYWRSWSARDGTKCPRRRSARSLAIDAFDEVWLKNDPKRNDANANLKHATVKRLSEIYQGTYQKKVKGKAGIHSNIDLLTVTGREDEVARSLQFADLKRIEEILADHRVPISTDKL